MGARFRIREGMMVFPEVVPAGCCAGLKLMVWKTPAEVVSGALQSVDEGVVGIVHLIYTHHGLQATFVEAGVVGADAEVLQAVRHLCPDFREAGRIVRILGS